jgi:hypothetical protein
MTDNTLLQAALEYARRGWPVLPLHPGEKNKQHAQFQREITRAVKRLQGSVLRKRLRFC